jgi:hypothetical protein
MKTDCSKATACTPTTTGYRRGCQAVAGWIRPCLALVAFLIAAFCAYGQCGIGGGGPESQPRIIPPSNSGAFLPQTLTRQAQKPLGQGKPAPLLHIYMNFLLFQNHLDKVAAAREAQGKSGWMRDYFQKQLGFTDSQFSAIRAAAGRLDPDLEQIRSRIKEIAKACRTAVASAKLSGSSPPSIPELEDLKLQRETAIQNEVDEMNQELGPDASAKLQQYLLVALGRTAPSTSVVVPITSQPSPQVTHP